MTAKIQQQQAAIDMIRMMVQSKRAPQSKLDAAINELNRLKADLVAPAAPVANSKSGSAPGAAPRRQSPMVKAIMADVNKDPIEFKQAALTDQAKRIRDKQAELSNVLRKVPEHEDCPDLVAQILDLHNQVEGIWTQKHFLERNKTDGPVKPAHDQQVVARSADAITGKAELTVQLQKLREKQSKLTKKLRDPRASVGNISKWEIELAQVKAAIDECTQKRILL